MIALRPGQDRPGSTAVELLDTLGAAPTSLRPLDNVQVAQMAADLLGGT